MRETIVQLWRAARIEFSPRLPPWSYLARDTSPTSQLRLRATRVGPLAAGSRKAEIKLLLISIAWHVKAVLTAPLAVIRYGPSVKALSGVGYFRQWSDATKLAYLWNYKPQTYYIYRLWEAEDATDYIQVNELGMLQMAMLSGSARLNKTMLAKACTEAGIPQPQLVPAASPLPRRSLFIKRVSGKQGAGAERWIYSDGRWTRGEISLTESDFLAHCRRLEQSNAIILQHCLDNHPDIARFSTGPLCTFRVITYLDGDTPTVLGVTLKLARTGADVDNLHAGSIACPVDHETGELGSGISRNPGERPWTTHPDTGEQIAGARLTTYRDVIELALSAHRKLDVPWSVGWDVAMTPEGAILVEGNRLWGPDLFHAPHRSGLPAKFARRLLDQLHLSFGG